jgi:hypothetical protein
MSVDVDVLDRRIAEDLLGEEFHPHWHRFSSEPEHAERLVEWLAEQGVRVELQGSSSVVLYRRRERLFAQAGDTAMIALARRRGGRWARARVGECDACRRRTHE